MKQILKTLGINAVYVVSCFLLAIAAVKAWDAEGTMSLKKDLQYRMEYAPETITDDYIEEYNSKMPDSEKIEFGHCDFENEDYQRGQETFDYAMMVYDENDGSIDFEDCLRIAEEVYNK